MNPSIPPSKPASKPSEKIPTERELKIRQHVRALEELVIKEPRPSMAVKAARKTVNLGKYSAIVLGAVTFASQIAAAFYPQYTGPITAILRLLGGGP